jgi:hypothetical protein
MIDNVAFAKKIQDIIRNWEYDMYLIHADSRINCICQNFETKQGDPKCPNCLGTGRKIYIKKIKAARQPYVLVNPIKGSDMFGSDGPVYYSRGEFSIHKNDIIVTGEYIDVIQYAEKYQLNSLSPVYYAAYGAAKKMDTQIFMQNFKKIIGG